MNWRRTDGIPAGIAAGLVCLMEVLYSLEVIPEQLSLENPCNFVMFTIAVAGFFVLGRPSVKEKPLPVSCVLGNMAVSLIAFPMNIDIFEHVIRPDHLLDDLWGWHLLWIFCAVWQLLVLTPLGKFLLAQLNGIWQWGKNIVAELGSTLLDLTRRIKKLDKRFLLFIMPGIVLWLAYLGIQIYDTDVHTVISDTDFWTKNLLCWVFYLFLALLLYLFSTVRQKSKEAVQALEAKRVLTIIAITVACAVSVFLLPFLLKVAGVLLALIGSLFAVMKLANKRDAAAFDLTDEERKDGQKGKDGGPDETPSSSKIAIRMKDLIVLLFFSGVIPPVINFLMALNTPPGGQLLQDSISDTTAWLEFGNAFLDVACKLLELFGIR